MGEYMRCLAGSRRAVLVALVCAGQALGEAGFHDPLCPPIDAEEEPLCGHALAAIAQIEAGQLLTPGSMTLESRDDTDVTHCFLDFELLFDTQSIAGTNTITVTSRTDDLTEMTLDFESGMFVDAVTVNGTPAGFTRPTDQILIDLGATYNQGESFTVQVAYHGSPKSRTDWGGFSFFSGSVAASFGQPFYARHWWPCKDNIVSVADKFTLDIHVTVPENKTAVCNGSLAGVDVLPNGRKKFRWHESYPIATYLVSFAAASYTKYTGSYDYPGGSMPVEIYSYSFYSVPYHLSVLVEAIGTFSALYGPYPFLAEKYGIAEFQWAGCMEHQTISSQGKIQFENTNIHELAHQWWGDAVTCKTWHDIWLHEGFATFSEALFKEKRPGGSYSQYIAHLNSKRPDTAGTGTVYRYDISTTASIFDYTYVYNKAAWVVHMLRHVMGDAPFAAALASYRAAFEGGSADTEDFRAACEAAYGGDLSWFFDEWIYSPGAPYYRYGWTQQQIEGQNWLLLHVQQYQKTVVPSFPAAMKMPVDIACTTTSGSQTHRIWTGESPPATLDLIEWFCLPVEDTVTAVQFDADTKIFRGDATQVSYVPEGPPRLTAMTPEPGKVLPPFQGPLAIYLHFSEAIAAASDDFAVIGSFSGPQAFTMEVSDNQRTVVLSFRKPLTNGQAWTVQIGETIVGLFSGQAFDGEMDAPDDPAALPSGDGTPGGSATITFFVAGFAPDLDHDNDVDAADMTLFQNCLTGPGQASIPPGCEPVDFDADHDVDQSDFGHFQRCLGENSVVPAADCLGL